LNLFSGPVFLFIKFSNHQNGRIFSQNSEKNFVPVFWMATEDHDFEEINHFKTEQIFIKSKVNLAELLAEL
jgi:uncharacterized protein YllA (UPF0747 family)